MNNKTLEKILKEQFPKLIKKREGSWTATTDTGFQFVCLTDEHHDRMRFIISILRINDCPKAFLMKCLEANFHSALDAKYSVYNGLLWSTFMHPLKSLTSEFAKDAILQTIKLANNTGTSYSTGVLHFVGGGNLKHKQGNNVARLTAQEIFEQINKVEKEKEDNDNKDESNSIEIPTEYCDPITFEIMTNPVLTKSGHTFERSTIMHHIKNYGTNPFTRDKLTEKELIPNRALKEAIDKWLKENQGKKFQ